MFKQFIQRKAFRFRRFLNKSYAAFCSMHREVTIGQVSAHIADLELLKAGKAVAVVSMLLLPNSLCKADETPPDGSPQAQLQLQEVSITAERSQFHSESLRLVTNLSAADIARLPIQTVADILQYVPGIDFRERGASGVQADVSIRGGTGKQVKILLNGIDLTDPQTEHYSFDIPIDPLSIERIEVLEGTNYQLDAFSGAINIITRSQNTAIHDSVGTQLKGSLAAGEYGLINPAIATKTAGKDWYINSSASYNRSSGYINNTDYKICNLFFQAGYKGIDFQAGAQYKDAGANSFYTVKYPNQFDATRTMLFSGSYDKQWGKWGLNTKAYYRGHYDRFETFREGLDAEGNAAPSWYAGPNLSWTHTTGAHLEGNFSNEWNRAVVGIDFRDELIRSTSLGNHNRVNIRYFAEEKVYWRGLTAAVGASGTWNSQFGNDWSVGANLGYDTPLSNKQQLLFFLSANRAIRIPTFTDLYYQTATQQANADTRPEKAWQLEFNTKYSHPVGIYLNASAYYRWGQDIIDWVKEPEATKWESINHTDVNAVGSEINFGYVGNKYIYRAEIGYGYCHLDKDAGTLLSLYALDYLKHKLTFKLEHRIYKGLGASWCFRYESREGEFSLIDGTTASYKPIFLLDGTVYWQNERLKLSLSCKNMTNRKYYDIGGVEQPRHWLTGKIEFVI